MVDKAVIVPPPDVKDIIDRLAARVVASGQRQRFEQTVLEH